MDGIVCLDVCTDVVVDNVWEEEITLRGGGGGESDEGEVVLKG